MEGKLSFLWLTNQFLTAYAAFFIWMYITHAYMISHGKYEALVTCVIVRSNPRRFSFHANGNASHYQSLMTSHDPCPGVYVMSWVPSAFSLKMPNKRMYCTTRTSIYHIMRRSSFLDWSKFSHRDRKTVSEKSV